MTQHPTPESFIRSVLIPGLQHGRITEPMPTGFTPLKGNFRNIVFINASNPREICHFKISSEKRDGKFQPPKATLFGNAEIWLGKKDWEQSRSTSSTTIPISNRYSSGLTEVVDILFSPESISRWKPTVQDNHPSTINVRISGGTFKLLRREQVFQTALSNYYSALRYLKDEIAPREFINRVVPNKQRQKTRTEPIELFLNLNSKHLNLYKNLGTARTKEEIINAIREHFERITPYAEIFAEQLAQEFKAGLGQQALELTGRIRS